MYEDANFASLAQLVERNVEAVSVTGSIPVGATKSIYYDFKCKKEI